MAETGVISGYTLKVVREGIGLTQAAASERFGVDLSTVQGWESGRRPLGSLRASALVSLRTRLTLLGCPLPAAMQISDAVEADMIVSSALEAGATPLPIEENPLAAAVLRRNLVNLVTWPFTGIVPVPLRGLNPARRRGPVADRPSLSIDQEHRFFDHLQVAADSARGPQGSVLRRQAMYLLGFDRRPSSTQWLAERCRAAIRQRVGELDLPAGLELRSASLALTRSGDLEPLRHLIDGPLSADNHDLAQLNYWAYWLGESPVMHSRDEDVFLAPQRDWNGGRLMEHLVQRLDEVGHADLNIHSLWSLVRSRRNLLADHPGVGAQTIVRLDAVETGGLGRSAVLELAKLRTAAELAIR